MGQPEECFIGGISCFGVLDKLSDYLDGVLEPDTVAQINAHIVACDECRRFGAVFGQIVARLRQELHSPEPLEPHVRQRLFARLRADLGP